MGDSLQHLALPQRHADPPFNCPAVGAYLSACTSSDLHTKTWTDTFMEKPTGNTVSALPGIFLRCKCGCCALWSSSEGGTTSKWGRQPAAEILGPYKRLKLGNTLTATCLIFLHWFLRRICIILLIWLSVISLYADKQKSWWNVEKWTQCSCGLRDYFRQFHCVLITKRFTLKDSNCFKATLCSFVFLKWYFHF